MPNQLSHGTSKGPGRSALVLAAAILAGALLAGCGARTAAPTLPAPPTVGATAAIATAPAPSAPTPAPAEAAVTAAPAPAVTASARPFNPEETPLRLETVADGFDMPVFLTNAGDGSGRLYVLEKQGRIRIIVDDTVQAAPFLDITDRVGSSSSEQGLLGLAFAPDYAESGTFFVDYTDRSGNTVISRFSASGDRLSADPASEKLVLAIDQPAVNHNGGMILFGPDGNLWVGTGDGGAANDRFGNGQNPQTLLGKMLRLDVLSDASKPYTIPQDNPWVNAQWQGQQVRPEIWALGLRNPWRYSFDKLTGDLWIGDVGQNTYEEVDLVKAGSRGGLNFGWPIMEGLHCFQSANCDATGLELPIIEYDHSGNCSVTGGYVYRGAAPALQGVYFYGDYCGMHIWAATQDAGGAWTSVEVLRADSPITSFGQDEQGELYIVESGGRISRLVEERL